MRYWTVEEARAYLPRLTELLVALRGAAGVATRARSNGHGQPATDMDPRDVLDELEQGDIVLRDPEQGLIDFHAVGPDGVVYLMCWRLGEEELAWWHLPDEGFAGRRPLPRVVPPEGGTTVSTRKLIIAALVCGLAILVAFALQVTLAANH